MAFWDLGVVYFNPLGVGNPLRRESLDLLDGVVRREAEERSDKVQAFIVGQMRRRTFSERFALQVLNRKEGILDKTKPITCAYSFEIKRHVVAVG